MRVSLDEGWRFRRENTTGGAAVLPYDVRPAVVDAVGVRPADARPEEAAAVAAGTQVVLKPWILPMANPFIRDPARHHVRPAGDPGADLPEVQAAFDDRSWTRVDLPHDWAIAGPFTTSGGGGMGRLPNAGVGWYRRTLDLPDFDPARSTFLEFDGAMSHAVVWCNGHLAGGWPYGYTSWRVDLTPYLRPGTNQLAVRLDHPGNSSRWYTGGGLYRHVWLTTVGAVRVGQWGVQVATPRVSAEAADLALTVTVENAGRAPAAVAVTTAIFALDADGRRNGDAVAQWTAAETTVAGGASAAITVAGTLTRPRLWGPPPTQAPHRYVAVTTVRQDGSVRDEVETPFGLRALRFDPDHGLLVNGEHVPIRGVNQHHDLGALGAAFNRRAAERQLEILRSMGCNAIRLSHNPPAPELLELTDRLGFLVVDEAFDIWERKKTPLDAHLLFPDWHEADLRALVRRDRHHPSVIVWSIGNEVGEQYTDVAGAAIAARLRDIVREEDPSRPVTAAMNWAKADMPLPAALDVIGLNYQGEGIRQDPEFEGTERIRTPPSYPIFHAKLPDKMIVTTESASAFSSRGVYLFPVTEQVSSPIRDGRGGDSKSRQVSAYELYAVDFGSSADRVFGSLDRHPFVAGEFVWTGWDYLGEPTPYDSSRSSYSGVIDLAGFPKDRYYLYQARWRPDLPMAHLLPHWTWPERLGQVTPVHVFTSGDEAELFLNGRSLGRKRKGEFAYRLRWDDVKYEPGRLEVVAYKDGREWARDVQATAGAPAGLLLEPDRAVVAADGRDLAFVTVRVVDAAGRVVPRADQRIRFTLSGPGEIIATDNGDATDLEPFPQPERKAFSGLCLVVVRGVKNQAGALRLTAQADGLPPASCALVTQ